MSLQQSTIHSAVRAYELAAEQCDGAMDILAHYRRQMTDNPGDALAKERFMFAKKLSAHRERKRQRAYIDVLRSYRNQAGGAA